MAPLPGMLWRWVPGGAHSFVCVLFAPEDLLQVDGEKGGAEGSVRTWAPCMRGATDTCKFPRHVFFFFCGTLLCSRAPALFRVGNAPEPQGHLLLGWELWLGCSIMTHRLMRAGPEPTAVCEVSCAELSWAPGVGEYAPQCLQALIISAQGARMGLSVF